MRDWKTSEFNERSRNLTTRGVQDARNTRITVAKVNIVTSLEYKNKRD